MAGKNPDLYSRGTPMISGPQSGILGTYAVVKRPCVVQDELAERLQSWGESDY